MSNNGHSPNSKKQTYIILLLILVIVVAVGIIIFLLKNNSEENVVKDVSGGRGTVVTQDNIDQVLNQKDTEEEQVQDGYYTTSMSLNWHFDGKESKDAYVANVTQNTKTVYFDLLLTDTGKMIYSSPYIPVGEKLNGVTLDTELDPGTYKTILVYHLVDDNHQELSTVSVALTIYVN